MLPDIVWTRPWLWLLMPIIMYAIWRFQHTRLLKQQAFLDWFDPHLFAHLSRKTDIKHWHWMLAAIYFSGFCVSVFFAGPAIQMADNLRLIEKRGAVVVLDLGLASLATDTHPSRLNHARYKIEDLLENAPNYEYGLVVVGKDAYTILPLSPDKGTLINQLSTLSPDILPEKPALTDVIRLDRGTQEAAQLLSNSGYSSGVIMVISYNPADEMLSEMTLSAGNYAVGFWQFGTQSGGPIKLSDDMLAKDQSGNILISKALPPDNIPGELLYVTNDAADNDIRQIVSLIKLQDTQIAQDTQAGSEQWIPIDSYFLFPVLLIILAFIRHPNWLISCWLLVLIMNPADVRAEQTQYAVPTIPVNQHWLPDNMLSKDNKAIQYLNEGQYQLAAETAQSVTVKSLGLIATNEFEEAKTLLQQSTNPLDIYHLGLVYFALKEYQDALSAFDDALQIKPDFMQAQENYDALLSQMEDQNSNSNDNNRGSDEGQDMTNQQDTRQPSSGTKTNEDLFDRDRQSGENPLSGSNQRDRASASGGPGGQTGKGSEEDEAQKDNFFEDLLVSKDKTHGDVDEEDIEQTDLFGTTKQLPVLDKQGIDAVVRKVPNDASFLLRQRLKLIQQRRSDVAVNQNER